MKDYETLVDAMVDLKERGYTSDFEAQSFCLYCGDLDIRLNPEEFHVDEVHRLEGEDSSPDDSSIVFAITSSTGVKGTLVDSYGPYAENLSYDMVQKLHNHLA
jgi:hypothetical protein